MGDRLHNVDAGINYYLIIKFQIKKHKYKNPISKISVQWCHHREVACPLVYYKVNAQNLTKVQCSDFDLISYHI